MLKNFPLTNALGKNTMTRTMAPTVTGRHHPNSYLYLANTYTTAGLTILKQTRGAPIGGFLSSNYANIKCAYDEYTTNTSSTVEYAPTPPSRISSLPQSGK